MSLAAKASFWYALCGVMQKGIAILVVPIYTRIMGVEAYGEYSVFQSWYVLLFIFTSLGLANYVFNNGMVKYSEDRDGFASAMLGLSGAVSIVFLGLFLLFPSFWVDLFGFSAPIVFLLFIRCLVTPSYELWSTRLRYEFRYRKVVALTLALTLLMPIVSVPVIMMSSDKGSAALVCQVLIMAIVYTIPFVSLLRKNTKLINLKYWAYALKFNLPLIPSMFATYALQQMDRILIANYMGESYAAIYSVAYSVGMIALFLVTSLDQAYRPWFYQKMEEGKRFSVNRIAFLLVGIIGLICLSVSLFAPEIMVFFAPDEYAIGAYAVAPVSAGIVAIMAFNIFTTFEYYYSKTTLIPVISITAACLSYALNYFLIPQFGFLVSAYITAFCYFALMIGHAFLCRRVLKSQTIILAEISIIRLVLLVVVLLALILAIQLLYPWLNLRIMLVVLLCIALFMGRKQLMHLRRAVLK